MEKTDKNGITARLVDYSLSSQYEHLPGNVITEAKKGFLDLLGVALAGSADPSTRTLTEVSGAGSVVGVATVLGTGIKTLPAIAALSNGYAAHALDYDDTQHRCRTHMSAPVLAAALPVAEVRRANGREVLNAYVTGFEIGCRLGRVAGFGDHLSHSGVHPIGVLGHFGAAAAAGRLLNLKPLQMNYCFAIAASQAAGLMRSLGTMSKPLQVGKAAQSAVFSAELANQDFSAAKDIFEGDYNFFSTHGATTSAEELTRGLGETFEILDNTIKVFACAGWRNSIVEAMILLSHNQALQPRDVKEVRISVWEAALKLPNYDQPKTGLESKFSSQHAAAVGLVDHAGGIEQFSDLRATDPDLAGLRRRVTVEGDGRLGAYEIRVSVATIDGREFSHFVPFQKGDPRNPVTWAELAEKFRANALLALPERQVSSLVEVVEKLEELRDVAQLTRLCFQNAMGRESSETPR
ncbi:MAG: MmgE/PrpD family protein [Deltaproteobacteria bacterium]|nr:MmgE/PrpD family protein [Deltaproteobacteria bacterium]